MTQTALPDPELRPEFYADVPAKRLFAWIIDTVAIALICLAILPFTGFLALFVWPALFLGVSFVYRTLSLARHSATPGMRFLAIELRGADGHRLDRATALLQTAGFTLSMAMVVVQLISVGLMVLSPRKQGLSDLFLGTVALNRVAAS